MGPKETYDIFCDASVGSNLRNACAASLFVRRSDHENTFTATIIPGGTNNIGEISAIARAVCMAADMKLMNPYTDLEFNLFSDSKVSVFAIRNWIYSWISYANGNTLKKFDREKVKNQIYIKIIFNTVITYGLRIRFYHQKAHTGHNYEEIPKLFYQNNGVRFSSLGLSPKFLAGKNDYVDKQSRKIILNYIATGNTQGYPIEMIPTEEECYEYPLIARDRCALEYYHQLIS